MAQNLFDRINCAELPQPLAGDPEFIIRFGRANGMSADEVDINAKTIAEGHWLMEEHRAECLTKELGLNTVEHQELLNRFKTRHQKIWGKYRSPDCSFFC